MVADRIRKAGEGFSQSGAWEAKWCDTTTFEAKFGPLISEDYQDVVFGYGPSKDKPSRAWEEIRKRHEYNREQALLLLHVESFRDRFFDFVRRWGLDTTSFEIDRGHFYREEPSGFNAWQQILHSLSVEYHIANRERFAEILQKLATDYSKDLDFRKLQRRRARVHRALPLPRFWWDVSELTRQSGLSAHWEPSIAGFALCGTLYVPQANCRLVVREAADEVRLLIEVFPETRTEDLEPKWKQARLVATALMPEQLDRNRPRKNLERDLLALRQTLAGKGLMDIVTEDLAPDDEDEIPLDELGEHDETLKEQVRKGIARIKEDVELLGVPRSRTEMSDLVERWSIHRRDTEHYF